MKSLMHLSFFIGCSLFIYGMVSYGNNMPTSLLITSVTLLAISFPAIIKDYKHNPSDDNHSSEDDNTPKFKEPNKTTFSDDISEFVEELDTESIEFYLYSQYREKWMKKISNIKSMPKETTEEVVARKEYIDNIIPNIWWMIDNTLGILKCLQYHSDTIESIGERYSTHFDDKISINRLNDTKITTINARIECGIEDNEKGYKFLICEHDLTFYLLIKHNEEVIYQLATSDYESDPILGVLYYFDAEDPSDIAKTLSWVEPFHRIGCMIQKLESKEHHQKKLTERAQIAKLNS